MPCTIIGSSPIGYEGFVQPRKGQGKAKLNHYYNNFVGYSYYMGKSSSYSWVTFNQTMFHYQRLVSEPAVAANLPQTFPEQVAGIRSSSSALSKSTLSPTLGGSIVRTPWQYEIIVVSDRESIRDHYRDSSCVYRYSAYIYIYISLSLSLIISLSHTTLSHTTLHMQLVLLLDPPPPPSSFLPCPSRYNICCPLLEEVDMWGYPVL